jgi:gamma-glutamylcyclotransferase (GGCT)/AIG2-like uncharacterized protein YtfP
MNNLFVYGTLKDPEMRKLLLNRDISEKQAILNDYVLKEDGDYYFIAKEKNHQVQGSVISISDDELLICDAWEDVPFYERVIVSVNIGGEFKNVWVYIRKTNKGKIVLCNKISNLDRDYVINQIINFKKNIL